ncbi:ead/Ea22-like family protein [Pseudomonas aeruginosa]|nr:ead/Ea22-like family protein [Pseudomonas aeruginosa]
MTDHAELRRVAEDVIRIERSEDEPISAAWDLFDSAATPKTVLAMLDEIDRLKAENDALRGALQAVVDDPTWRSNDNTLWPKIIKAMDKGATK